MENSHTPARRPSAFPGEKFLSSWHNVKFFVGASEPHGSGWAPLAAFYGFGHAHLSTCRLVFILEPPPSLTVPHHLSIPLVWLRKDRLHIRRPFFDSKHLAGVLVPADVTHTALGPSPVFATPGKPMEFRIEMLDSSMNDELCGALHEILADPDRIAKDTRVLRKAVDKALIPTDVHYAFVDPTNPSFLHLGTQMTHPEGCNVLV